jgi:hypothetical protein
MTSTHKVPKKISAVFAIIFLLPAVYIFAIWTNTFSQDVSQSQKITLFTDHFPHFLNDYKTILWISIVSSLAAMVLAAKSFKQPIIALRIAMWLTVIIAALIFFLDIFQLL